MKKYYLALERGSLQTSIHPLLGLTTIGRGPDNTIIIQEPTASRSHARVSFQDDAWCVEDMGSTNGVLVGKKRIKQMRLKGGDTFQIGDITFRLLERELTGEGQNLSETVQILSASVETAMPKPRAGTPKPSPERLQEAIAAIPFFSSLGEKDLDKLASTSTLHIFQPGEAIIRQGDAGRSVFLILHGRVRVFTRDYKGQELELAVLGVSQFFGEMSFLTGQPRSGYVAAVENSVLIELSYTTMYRLVQEHPQVKQTLVKYYRERTEGTKQKREEAGVPERRHTQRVAVEIPVAFTLLPAEGATEAQSTKTTYRGISRNLSTTGIVVECRGVVPRALTLGARLRLLMQLGAPGGKVRAVGVIRRFQAAAGEGKGPLLAIEFVAMPQADTKALKAFLHGEDHLQ
ncbi:MAG TPA: cyclic nucleotide-binding domain-containing protein [Syntrophobacteria bacterium]|nr:cyclic nucleotide-binding domain-containing protein [Syntrophobacteria bacterium]